MKNTKPQYELKGICPICDREMFDNNHSINRHHFIPKSRGGKEMEYCHRICHDMIHRTWSNKELEHEFSDPEKIKSDQQMTAFIAWVKKKDPLFYIRSDNNKNKKK